MKQLLMIFVLAVTACSVGPTVPNVNFQNETIRIFGDVGGNPYEYAELWEKLHRSGKRVELGECNSACTMLLSLPNSCMLPKRRFGFHASRGLVSDSFVADYLPGALKSRYLSVWSRSQSMIKFTSEELKSIEPSLSICAL